METGGRLTTPIDYSLLSELYDENYFNQHNKIISGENNKRRIFKYRLNHRIKNVVDRIFNRRLPSHHLHIITQEEYMRHKDFSIFLVYHLLTDVGIKR